MVWREGRTRENRRTRRLLYRRRRGWGSRGHKRSHIDGPVLPPSPQTELHHVAFRTAAVEPGMVEVVPEPVRVQLHTGGISCHGHAPADAVPRETGVLRRRLAACRPVRVGGLVSRGLAKIFCARVYDARSGTLSFI